MTPRVVIITGCSTGIGLSAAVLLAKDAQKKFKVYATMRNLAKKDELVEKAGDCFNKTLFLLQLDVCSEASVEAGVKEVLHKEGRVDVLINNAGIGLMGALEHQKMDTITSVIETNLTGVIRTVRAVLPTMKKQRSGHIMNVSSIGGLNAFVFCAVYAATKYAVIGLSESLAPELLHFNIHVSVIEPGLVTTPFTVNTMAQEISGLKEGDDTTKELLSKVNQVLLAKYDAKGFVQTPDEIASCMLQALNAEKPHFHYLTSPAYQDAMKKKYFDLTGDSTIAANVKEFIGTK